MGVADHGHRVQIEDRGGAGVGGGHLGGVAGDEEHIVDVAGPVSDQAALQAHDIEVAGGEVGDEFEPVLPVPAQTLADNADEVARRHQRDAARAVGDVHGIGQAGRRQRCDEAHPGLQAAGAAGGQHLHADGEFPFFYLAREGAVFLFFFVVNRLEEGGRVLHLKRDLPSRLVAVQVVVHLADVGRVDLAAPADQAHPAEGHIAGEFPHELGVDAGQIPVADAPQFPPVGHEREHQLVLLDDFHFFDGVEKRGGLPGRAAVDSGEPDPQVKDGLHEAARILVPAAIPIVVQGHVDDEGGWISIRLRQFDEGLHVGQGGEGLQHERIHAGRQQRVDLLAIDVFYFLGRFPGLQGGPDRAEDEVVVITAGLLTVRGNSLPGHFYTGAVQLLDTMFLFERRQVDAAGREGVGRQTAGPGLQIGSVNLLDQVGPVRVEGLVHVVHLREPAGVREQIGAHGAVGQKRGGVQDLQ